MNFLSVSVPVSHKIKSIDQGIIGTCQDVILAAMRTEIFAGLDQNHKLSIEVVHQLSLECVLIQVDIWDELDSETVLVATLFLINFSVECGQLHILNLMNLRDNLYRPADKIAVIDFDAGKKYNLKSSRIFFESNSFSTDLVTKIRAVCFAQCVNDEDKKCSFIIPDSKHKMVLTGTREVSTGKLFYFPVMTQPTQ